MNSRTPTLSPAVLLTALVWGLGATSIPAELTLNVAAKTPPADLPAAYASLVKTEAVQLLAKDKPAYEFWFRKEMPLKKKPSSPAQGLAALAELTVMGIVAVSRDDVDYREDDIPSGLYTMRLGLIPEDGNHLGTSDHPYFAVLTPVKLDPKPDGIKSVKQLVKISSQETSSDHPVILSLRPPNKTDGTFPRLEEPAKHHKSIRLSLHAKAGNESVPLIFDLVYEGVAEF